MHTYLIRYTILYYDIGWNIHSVDIAAESIQAAIAKLLAAYPCSLGDVITYYPDKE